MTEQTLARARAGDEDAFRELTDPYRRELQLHIYRIVGSVQDAEDLLQETLLAAWRGLDAFEERASLRAWLYRIATNRSLDALRASRRRPEEARMTHLPEPTRWNEPLWLEPYPDVLLEGVPDEAPGPGGALRDQRGDRAGLRRGPTASAAAAARGAGAARRLGYRAGEVAGMLETSEASVNSLLRRARAAFERAYRRRARPCPAAELKGRARHRRPLRRHGRERRHRRFGRPPDRRRVAHDAAAPARLPGTRRDRRVPARRRGAARRTDAAGSDAREHTAGVRLLPLGAGAPESRVPWRCSC